MIPVLIVLGLALGRWWRTSIVLAAVAWPAALVATDVMDVKLELLAASALAVANVSVGILVNRTVARGWGSLRPTGSPA